MDGRRGKREGRGGHEGDDESERGPDGGRQQRHQGTKRADSSDSRAPMEETHRPATTQRQQISAAAEEKINQQRQCNGSRCVPALGRQTGAAQDTPPAAHCFNVHGPGKFSHAALLPVPCSGHAPHAALLNTARHVLPTPSLSAGSCIPFRRHAAASPVRCPAQQSLERTSHHDAPPTAALEWHTRERRVQGRGGDTGEGEAQDYELKAKPRGWRQAR